MHRGAVVRERGRVGAIRERGERAARDGPLDLARRVLAQRHLRPSDPPLEARLESAGGEEVVALGLRLLAELELHRRHVERADGVGAEQGVAAVRVEEEAAEARRVPPRGELHEAGLARPHRLPDDVRGDGRAVEAERPRVRAPRAERTVGLAFGAEDEAVREDLPREPIALAGVAEGERVRDAVAVHARRAPRRVAQRRHRHRRAPDGVELRPLEEEAGAVTEQVHVGRARPVFVEAEVREAGAVEAESDIERGRAVADFAVFVDHVEAVGKPGERDLRHVEQRLAARGERAERLALQHERARRQIPRRPPPVDAAAPHLNHGCRSFDIPQIEPDRLVRAGAGNVLFAKVGGPRLAVPEHHAKGRYPIPIHRAAALVVPLRPA